jgi:hypothetical protein
MPGRFRYEERAASMRKTLLLAGVVGAAVALLARSQRQDATRYVKIKQMSMGNGHPENVPVSGSHGYPAAGHGVADGTGDFDAASRGGLATTPVR